MARVNKNYYVYFLILPSSPVLPLFAVIGVVPGEITPALWVHWFEPTQGLEREILMVLALVASTTWDKWPGFFVEIIFVKSSVTTSVVRTVVHFGFFSVVMLLLIPSTLVVSSLRSRVSSGG